MSHPLVSIILPIYNARKFLPRCLDSIRKQTYTNFEALLVNDGSTDDSLAYCRKYAAKDSRFRVFTQENGGIGSARNVGLDNMVKEPGGGRLFHLR